MNAKGQQGMSSLRGRLQDVENPPTYEDNESVVLDDTYSINSDATRLSITPVVDDSYSVVNSAEAISTLPPAAQQANASSRLSRFFNKLCCWRKRNHSAEHQSTNSCQCEISVREYVEKLEEMVKTCQVNRTDMLQCHTCT